MKKAFAVGLASVAVAAILSCSGVVPSSPSRLMNSSASMSQPGHSAEPAPKSSIRPARTLQFSGYDWVVKASDHRVGPGPNYFSDSDENISVDAQGRLHLRLTQRDGRWHCAEVISAQSFGYGT